MDIGKIDIDCPECGSKLRVSIADIASEHTVTCSRGHRVKLVDEGGGARKADGSLKDLDRALKRLGGQ